MPTPASSPLPRFNDLQGSGYYSLPLKPPFAITNLSCRLFPLRANPVVLQSFCNNYVNIVPPEIAQFRASMPYIFLMMLDYGSLALEATNLGWFSQHEIMFCVPVEWYTLIDGRLVFRDWCMLTPFIFVDDDLSLSMGRTVAGWPKTFASMTPTLSAWMKNPSARVNEATASAMVFPELYAGLKQEQRVFLEIERDAPASLLRMPPDVRSPLAPWSIAANMMDSMAGLGRDAVAWMSGLGILPLNDVGNSANFQRMMGSAARMMNPLRPNMTSNILNLKQFRASEEPDRYCYQALTIGSMKFTSMNSLGMLGEEAVRAGDISGGYRLKLHEWPSIPITRLLGLETERRWRGDGVDVVEIKPVMPYWYDCNMDYATGYNVAWRGRDAVWHDLNGHRYPPRKANGIPVETEVRYNTTLGPSAKPVAGPFRFEGTTLRVLPLVARQDALRIFVDDYLNKSLRGSDESFELWAAPDDDHAYIYATATSFGSVTSGTNNVGDWAQSELAFLIPVKRYTTASDGTKSLAGVGLVPAYTYVDNVTAALAGSEVLGIPTVGATFIEAESSWMSEEGPAADAQQALLRVDAEILPAMGEGERTRRRTIVDIVQGTPKEAGTANWRNTADRWSAVLREELARKKRTAFREHGRAAEGGTNLLEASRAVALEILANRAPLSLYTMKQFRDNADPDYACYQSLVLVHRTLYEVVDMREIERPLLMLIHDYPTQALVRTLGIVGKPVRGDGLGVAYGVHPVRPFWMRVIKEEDLGRPLAWRAGGGEWLSMPNRTTPSAFIAERDHSGSYFTPGNTAGIGVDACHMANGGDPRHLVKACHDWKIFVRSESSPELDVATVAEAVETIDPQMVIESILSREWGNWDEHARWREGRRSLVAEYEKLLSGTDADNAIRAEEAFFQEALRKLGRRPGDPPLTRAHELVEQLKIFATNRRQMEKTWEVLVNEALNRLYPKEMELEKQAALRATAAASLQGARGAPPAPPNDHTRHWASVKLFIEFIEQISTIAALEVLGQPSSPDNPTDLGARDNLSRLTNIVASELVPLKALLDTAAQAELAGGTGVSGSDAYTQAMDAVWAARDIFRDAVALARDRCGLQREALFNQLAKAFQKPDFCVARLAGAREEERLYPIEESWDRDWYAGPAISDSEGQLFTGRAAQAVME